jgi:hypothetical protein
MLERGPCFGNCASFRAVIYKDRTATYEGRSSAVRQGLYKSSVSRSQLKHIRHIADSLRLDTLQSAYVNERIADLPAHRFSVEMHGKMISVHVSDTDPPSVIGNFEKQVEALIDSLHWIKQQGD